MEVNTANRLLGVNTEQSQTCMLYLFPEAEPKRANEKQSFAVPLNLWPGSTSASPARLQILFRPVNLGCERGFLSVLLK